MNKKQFLLLSLLLTCFGLFLLSCNDSFELDNSIAIKQENKVSNEYMIEVNDAVAIASRALDMFNGQTMNSRNANVSKSVKRVITYPVLQSRSSDASLYIVNFEEGGFAIVPSDSRATDVYALSNEGEFNLENESSAYFIELAETYLQEEINNASLASITPVEPITPPDGGPEMYLIVEYEGKEYYWNSFETQTIPFYLLTTKWHQGDPYRHFCFTPEGQNAVAGCVPIAMAQIMAYHKKPESFNNHFYQWNYLTQTPTISPTSWLADNVGYLVHDIGKNAKIKYGTTSSSVINSNALETFQNFGYSASLEDYDEIEIRTFLNNSKPIYISGVSYKPNTNNAEYVGHAWVIDGYYVKTTVDEYYDIDTLDLVYRYSEDELYLHCNWGWGYGDCYCLSEIFMVNEYNFNMSNVLIYAQ